MWLVLALSCTADGPGHGRRDRDPGVAPTTSSACASAVIGPAGGAIALDGVELTFPPGALVEDGEVELCTDGVAPDGVEPVSLVAVVDAPDPALPASIVLPHHGGPDVALWAPGDGGIVRQLRATDRGDRFEAPLYELGVVYAASDTRLVEALQPHEVAIADLLFVVDNTAGFGEMILDQVALGDAGPVLLEALDGVDFHVGVITTDTGNAGSGNSGRLREIAGQSWIDPATEDPARLFEQMAVVGTAGTSAPQGLATSYRALFELQDTVNAGFARGEADLAVVVLSNRDDQTPADVIGLDEYAPWLAGTHADPGAVSFHAAVLDGGPEPGTRYLETSAAVGGVTHDLGGPGLPTFLEDMVAFLGADRVALGAMPTEGTLEVWVVPADPLVAPYRLDDDEFDYAPVSNVVRVRPAEHADGDAVFVLYAPAD